MRKLLLLPLILLAFIPLASATYPNSINTAIVCYGIDLDSTQIDYISQFDLVDMNFGYSADVDSLHTHNADIIVLGYRDIVYARESPIIPDWSTILSNPSWFLKDDSGNFVYSSYWGCYVMNISNTAYQQHVIDWINTQAGSSYDGVFCDDAWMHLEWYSPGFNATLTADTFTNWNSWMEDFVEHLALDLDELVIVNSDEIETDVLLADADGQCLEYFVHHQAPSTVWLDQYRGMYEDLERKNGEDDKILFCLSFYTQVSEFYDTLCVNECYERFRDYSVDPEHTYWGMNTYSEFNQGYEEVMDLDTDWGELTEEEPPAPTALDTQTVAVLPPQIIIVVVIGIIFGLVYMVYKDLS